MGSLILDAQMLRVARDLHARAEQEGPSFNLSRSIRDIHDEHMLVRDQQFGDFAHDVTDLFHFQRDRKLEVRSLNPVRYLKYRLNIELNKAKRDNKEGEPT